MSRDGNRQWPADQFISEHPLAFGSGRPHCLGYFGRLPMAKQERTSHQGFFPIPLWHAAPYNPLNWHGRSWAIALGCGNSLRLSGPTTSLYGPANHSSATPMVRFMASFSCSYCIRWTPLSGPPRLRPPCGSNTARFHACVVRYAMPSDVCSLWPRMAHGYHC